MSRYIYRPNHPLADEFGTVDVDLIGSDYEPASAPGVIKHYDSKSEFRKATKRAGCVEVGNELATVTKPRKPVQLSRTDRRNEIRRAIRQLQGH